MEFEDEYEFFSFLPSEFYLEVHKLVEKTVEGSISSEQPVSRCKIDRAEGSIEKNMLIFERFTLRNIFAFPESFAYDRRATTEDAVPPEYLKDQMLSLALQKEKLNSQREVYYQKRKLLSDLKKYAKDVENVPDMEGVLRGLEELNILVRQTREIRKKYIERMPQNKPLKRELEEEVRKKECQDLEKRIPMEILNNLENILSAACDVQQ